MTGPWKENYIDFDDYQRQARETKIYPDDVGITYPLIALAGEVGEAANKWKKVIRGDKVLTPELAAEIGRELGDCLWYIANACTDLGISLQGVAEENLTILRNRKERGVIKGDGDKR